MGKYYAVKIGKRTGIFMTWPECESVVKGFPGAVYKSFQSQREAEDYLNGTVTVPINRGVQLTESATRKLTKFSNPKSIYTDAGHNKTTGDCAFASVVDYQGVDAIGPFSELFPDMELRDVTLPVGERRIVVAKFTGVATQQINGGELLGLVCGLRIALTVGIDLINEIFCDSKIILYWSLRLGDEQRRTFDPRKVAYIDELIQLRSQFESNGGRVVKIDAEENPADLGFHRSKRKK